MAETYQKALVAATDEIQELLKKRVEIDERLGQLKSTVEALSLLLTPPTPDHDTDDWAGDGMIGGPPPDISDVGISDAIRQVLVEAKAPLTPPEIRNALARRGVVLSEYANPLVVIHNTLKRLQKQGELMVMGATGQAVSYTIVPARIRLLREGERIVGVVKINTERGKVFDDKE